MLARKSSSYNSNKQWPDTTKLLFSHDRLVSKWRNAFIHRHYHGQTLPWFCVYWPS
uniref:Uncharacterized protein n=1 Tax=Arundo donax TaxID=35708 RepID=A0A0A9C8G3_ARUDO